MVLPFWNVALMVVGALFDLLTELCSRILVQNVVYAVAWNVQLIKPLGWNWKLNLNDTEKTYTTQHKQH